MDQSHPNVARDRPLDRLVADALDQLQKLDYSRRSLRRYRTIWQRLIAFAHQGDLGDTFSEDLAVRFMDAYRLRADENIESSECWRRHVVFSIRVLEAFARDGRIERCRTDMQKVEIPPAMNKPLRDYEVYGRDRLYLRPSTLSSRIRELAIFLGFLGSRNLKTLDQLQPADLSAFVMWRPRLRPKTISRILSDVRSFLTFLTLKGILQRDLSGVLPTIRVPQDAAIPSVWDPELLARLLKVVDRSSPRGKRDYAILLLACRLGLRLGDIRALRLENLNWEAATIDIIQSKTGAPLQLPLTEEVGEALIDYLRAARPPADRTPRGVPQTEPTFCAVQRKQSSPPDRHALEETGRDRVSEQTPPWPALTAAHLGHRASSGGNAVSYRLRDSRSCHHGLDVDLREGRCGSVAHSVALDTEELAHGE